MLVVRGDKREYLLGLCNDFDAKMWVLLVFGEIKIFRGQDVKNFRQDYCGRWCVGKRVLKFTFLVRWREVEVVGNGGRLV